MYCPHPFSRLEIKADGNVYCCCEGWLPKPLGNILDRNLMDIWSGASAEAIRNSVADGSFQYCTACPYLPGPGGPVVTDRPSIIDTSRIQTLKLDYDQSCNLTCPSCRVVHSREFVNVPMVTKIHEAVLSSRILDRTNQLYVTGAGDPFASDLYWNFLQTYTPSPNTHLFLHTNGLLFNEEHWNKLAPIHGRKVVEVGISVDAATPRTYKKNRQASWTKLWSNIDFINRLQDEGVMIMLGFFFTVQANNFREILPFTRLAFNHRAQWISITALRNWGVYTDDDYQARAVHLPTHPDYEEFRSIITSETLTRDRRIVLDSFNPTYTNQEIVCNDGALIPERWLRRNTP
jgi:radical SAM protein with 4Fe4S-binding SPASM domain